LSKIATLQPREGAVTSSLPTLSLAALGVVFGDIGTSPLYTLKTVLGLTGANPDPTTTLGALSLVIWTLIVVTTIKYVSFAMRVDNDGEGGILALMSLLGVKRQHRPVIVAVGLFGAALIYGDGAITPAISVLSALEGLDIVTSTFHPYILPAAVVILIALFAVQPLGTTRIGRAFGPIMALWFAVMAVLGLWGIIQHPTVLFAINPRYGLAYLLAGGQTGFLVLGGVFLCVTGAEALYADMGHFGARPIRLAWSAIVFPSLVLNYAGQAALVLEGAPTTDKSSRAIATNACRGGWRRCSLRCSAIPSMSASTSSSRAMRSWRSAEKSRSEDCPPPSHPYENTSDAQSNLQSVARAYQPISAGRPSHASVRKALRLRRTMLSERSA